MPIIIMNILYFPEAEPPTSRKLREPSSETPQKFTKEISQTRSQTSRIFWETSSETLQKLPKEIPTQSTKPPPIQFQ
jgi:hypothetical protein